MKPKKLSAKKKVIPATTATPLKSKAKSNRNRTAKSKTKKAVSVITTIEELKPEKKTTVGTRKLTGSAAKAAPSKTGKKLATAKIFSKAKTAETPIEKPILKSASEKVIPKSEIPKAPVKRVAAKKKSVKRPAKIVSRVSAKPARTKSAPRKLVLPETPPPRTIEIKHLPATPPPRKAPANIPAILFEGDKPGAVSFSGPGQRYVLGPKPPLEASEGEGELPEAYGTQQLLLAARDPHWLYAHWDLTSAQQRNYNSLSMDRHLVLRIHQTAVSAKPVQEVHVHPESRHWFVHVTRAGMKYLAELGYYRGKTNWITIATSGATLTPPDSVSEDTSAEFATIPFELPMAKLLSLVKEAVQENVPLAEALQEMIAEGHPELIEVFSNSGIADSATQPSWTPAAEWTPSQEMALAEILSMDSVRRVWMGSLEITELIRRQVMHELASMAAANLGGVPEGAPTSPAQAPGAISSPAGRRRAVEKGFWFNVNAELIIYGATEPDAAVTIAGRKIRLRPDGSFSYRFALPDGTYELPVVAVSADQTDGRAAELVFSRSTEIRGDVGAHPQDPELKRPEAASL